jgi:hypothetical protein
MKKIIVKDEFDVKIDEIRKNNRVMVDLQNGNYEGLSIIEALNAYDKHKGINSSFDRSHEERNFWDHE